MSFRLLDTPTLLVALTLAIGSGLPSRPDDPTPDSVGRRTARLDEEPIGSAVEREIDGDLLQRWNRLTPEEQGRLRQRFEHYKTIDVSERKRLAKRGKRLDQLARQLYRELPDEDRQHMDDLPATKRREIMREMAADKARDVGRRIHDKLPPPLRRRLANASPEDRERFLEDFRARQRERMGDALARLGEELEIEDSVIKRITRLPDDKRGKKFLEFLQRRASVEVGRRGLPPGVTPEQWRAIWDLPGDEFFEAIMELREAHPTLAMPPSVANDDARTGRPGRPRHSDAKRHLIRAGRRLPADRIELSGYNSLERRDEIQSRRRKRVERVLRDESLLTEAELDELADLPDAAFLDKVRAKMFE
ncbi:MAG: hypothetical protein ACI80N_000615 [Gammaproteobacteria bacterium]|jgi:hypothetical protein